MKKILLTTLAILCTNYAVADQLKTSRVDLSTIPADGTLKADSELVVSLQKLKSNIYYNVFCTLTNVNSEKVDIAAGTNDSMLSYPNFFINDTAPLYGQASLHIGDNSYSAKKLAKYSSNMEAALFIRNLDDTNSIKVAQCYAEPST